MCFMEVELYYYFKHVNIKSLARHEHSVPLWLALWSDNYRR